MTVSELIKTTRGRRDTNAAFAAACRSAGQHGIAEVLDDLAAAHDKALAKLLQLADDPTK
jgi:hypothetical protein